MLNQGDRDNLAFQYKFNIDTTTPCISCKNVEGKHCQLLDIAIANPRRSTCPGFEEEYLSPNQVKAGINQVMTWEERREWLMNSEHGKITGIANILNGGKESGL